jgi:glutathione S-transferase
MRRLSLIWIGQGTRGILKSTPYVALSSPPRQNSLTRSQRGLVPTIDFNGEIIAESGIVSTFLADAYPSHVFPASGTPDAALKRARINFFVDTWFSKVGSYWFKILQQDSDEEKEKLGKEFVSLVNKDIEPLLKDAKPFFGGSSKITLAEVG